MDAPNYFELWDFDDPVGSEARFRAALAETTGEDALVLRTQLARALGLQDRFDEAHEELRAVSAAAGLGPLVRCHVALERGRLLRSAAASSAGGDSGGDSGDADVAMACFASAAELAAEAGADHLAVDAVHMQAITAGGAEQIPFAQRALELAEASANPRARRWIASVTHNLGWTMHDLGRYDDALRLWERTLAARIEQGDAEPIRVARWTVARGLRSLGRYDEARAIQLALAAEGPPDPYVDEELAELDRLT